MKKKILGIIPARYESSRFPGKPLVKLLGKQMIIWVAELASMALGQENVIVATDDSRIKDVVEEAGYNAIITSKKHPTGTDRLAEVAVKIEADIYVNIQGDEPTVSPEIIRKIINYKLKRPDYIINAMTKLTKLEDPKNINIPKVITNQKNDLVYMSRVAIPGYKNIKNKPTDYYKQVCIYAFSRNQLLKFRDWGKKSNLEISEDIEILRFLETGLPVRMIEVAGNSYAVDVENDIPLVETRLKEIHKIS